MTRRDSEDEARVLLLMTEGSDRDQTGSILKSSGIAVRILQDESLIQQAIASYNPHLVLYRLDSDRVSWRRIMATMRRGTFRIPLILLGSTDSTEEAISCLDAGVYDYIQRPFHPVDFVIRVRKALEEIRGQQEIQNLKREMDFRRNSDYIVGNSRSVQNLLGKILLVADKDISVLIEGESGSGKELVARSIHYSGLRARRPFVALNCAAIPEDLMANELFGHEKGAYTGADELKKGLFEQADGGTIFLDEVAELDRSVQAKFLRVLESGEVRRVGGTRGFKVDVRVVAATHRSLKEMVSQGLFRDDLYYRLNIFPIRIDPLRERSEDIPLLLQHFITKFNAELSLQVRGIQPDALQKLMCYSWPGNVRELENKVKQAMILARGIYLVKDDLSIESDAVGPAVKPMVTAKKEFERNYLVDLLKTTRGNISQAARLAGKERKDFYEALRRNQIEPGTFRNP